MKLGTDMRGLHDGNRWRKYRVVPHAHPSRPLFMLVFIGLEAKGLLDFQARQGITSIVRWNLHPVIFPEGPKIKKIRDFDRDWKFRSRMKVSSEPPTAALVFVGKSTSRLKISSEIKNFDRDQKFRSRSNFFDRWALWVWCRWKFQKTFPGRVRVNLAQQRKPRKEYEKATEKPRKTPKHCFSIATSLAFYRSQKGLSLENSEKSLKRGSRGLSAPGSKKHKKSRKKKLKKGRKLEKNLKNVHFRLFFGFFDPGAPRPREPLFRLCSEFFREKPFWLL